MQFLARLFGRSAYVLKDKMIDLDGPCFIRLVGRKGGVIAWLFTLIGLNATVTLEVYEDRIEYTKKSWSGYMLEIIPLSKVSNLVCARLKPFIYFVWAAVAAYCAYRYESWIPLIVTVIMAIMYFLKKTVMISIVPHSGQGAAIAFKRSIIENKGISDEEAQEIIKMVAVLIENATKN